MTRHMVRFAQSPYPKATFVPVGTGKRGQAMITALQAHILRLLMRWVTRSARVGIASLLMATFFVSAAATSQAAMVLSEPEVVMTEEEPNDPDYVPAQPGAIPKVLIRKDLAVMTPTLWCKNHRNVCVDELVKQYSTKFANGNMGRTQWTSTSSGKIEPVHKRAYRALCEGESAPTTVTDPTACPSVEGTTMTADQAWSRFRSNANCAYEWVPYAGQPQYRLMCKPLAPGEAFSDAQRAFVRCQAFVLYTSGAALAHDKVTGSATGGFIFAVGEGGCALGFVFDHFLNW